MDLRAVQKLLKDPTSSLITLSHVVPTQQIDVVVEGELDLRGTLGITKDVPIGFERIRVRFAIVLCGARIEGATQD